MIVGLTGPNAAGKGEVARVLRERGFAYHSLSDVVREEATARGLDHSRENLIRVGNELRARSGPGVLAERIAAMLARETGPPRLPGARFDAEIATGPGDGAPTAADVIVDSIRSPAEVEVLRRLPGFVLLGVDAPIAVRFERSSARGRIGDGATFEEFVRKEALENTNDPAAQQLAQALALADLVLDNAGTLEALRAKVTAALRLSP